MAGIQTIIKRPSKSLFYSVFTLLVSLVTEADNYLKIHKQEWFLYFILYNFSKYKTMYKYKMLQCWIFINIYRKRQ